MKFAGEGLKQDLLDFALDAAKNTNSIVFMYPCKNACCFCVNRQKGPLIPEGWWRMDLPSDDDLNKIVDCLDFTKNVIICICDNFEFPKIYQTIEKIHKRMIECNSKAKIQITSTFASFDISKLSYLKEIKDNLFVDISVLTFDTNLKSKLMGGGWTESQTNTLKEVIRSGIADSMTPWYFGDIDLFKKDLEILDSLIPEDKYEKMNFSLDFPHSTNYSNEQTIKIAEKSFATYDQAIELFLAFMKKHNCDHYLFVIKDMLQHLGGQKNPEKDTWSSRLVKDFANRVEEAVTYLTKEGRFKLEEVGFTTAEPFYNYAKTFFPHLNWVCVRHSYWGGTITSAALLTLSDVSVAINSSEKYKAYVISRDMLNESGGVQDLHRKTPEQLKQEIGAEIYVF